MNDLDRLNTWKKKLEEAKQRRASLEGKKESLLERATSLRESIQKDFGVSTVKELEKKITEQESKVKTLADELEGVFSGREEA